MYFGPSQAPAAATSFTSPPPATWKNQNTKNSPNPTPNPASANSSPSSPPRSTSPGPAVHPGVPTPDRHAPRATFAATPPASSPSDSHFGTTSVFQSAHAAYPSPPASTTAKATA